ncbi:AGAP006158-PA-like protein [Anopheles sinensis]|uniref:AGAP006158-PA-like protein n=1 Tax=Anopheles sinensis TaxID=74873 RepID=A0A084WEN6_ANOSI|nr:AGAP006158-PA-like protein [Anopheles sinensis]
MEVNTSSAVTQGKAGFKFSSASDDILLNIHHTVDNNSDGTILRVRFTAAGFSANNERLIAVDHRGNVFVFYLIGQKYWLLAEKLKKITVIEGLSGGNLVACANKEGMVYVVDIDEKQPTVKIKALPASVLGLAQSPDPVQFNPHLKPQTYNTGTCSRYLLVNGQQSAKVYQADGLTEVSSLNYGFTSHSAVHLKEWHWFSGPNGPSLISYSASGIIKAYRINFTLIKELNVTRLIGLYLKNTSAQLIEFGPTANAGGGGDVPDKMERVIKRITEDSPNGFVKAAQVSPDGRYYALLCSNNSLAFLALESWLVCRVVAFSNLFIMRYAFLPNATTSATGPHQRPCPSVSIALVAQTVDNDLMLLNFGQCNRKHPPTLLPLAMRNRALRSEKSKCYKFCPAPNGRMLANVLTSGEVLLHNLDAYMQSNVASPAVSILPGTEKLAPGVTGRSQPNYYGKSLLTGSASSSSSSVTLYGSAGANRQKVKIERQMDAIQSEITKTLPKERLLPIVKEYGEYPPKHRPTIWRTLLELPSDAESFGALLQRGHHPCVASLDERRFPSQDSRTVRNVKKIVSCLAHWCPVFGLIDYLPYFVFPFVRQHPNDALVAFETVATVLLNQCQLWFEFAPLEPWNYLAMVENVLAEFEPRLMSFYRSHGIPSRAYTLPLMETAFSRCFLAERWVCLWDHVVSNEPYFPVFLIAAYNALHRGALISAGTGTPSPNEESITNFFHQSSSVDVRRVVRRAYDLMERCPDAIHPRNYFNSFVPLSGERRMLEEGDGRRRIPYPCAAMQQEPRIDRGTFGRTVYHSAGNNAIDFTRPRRETPSSEGGTSMDVYWPSSSVTEGYVNFCNFPKALTDVRCSETNALQAEQRRLEAKIIELEKLEHSLKDRMVNNLIRQEHEERVKKVEQNFEEAISREEQRIEMQRKLLLLHRKQLRERESELSLDLHNAKLINDATVRERELDGLLKKLQRERQREETDLLFAEEDIKLKELELLAHYRSETMPPPVLESATSDECRRPDHPRYQQALEQLAVQKQKLYDEIDRTYSSLGMPIASNEYTYRTVTELRKVASVASNERYPSKVHNHPVKEQQPPKSRPIHAVTSQVKVCKLRSKP